MYLPLDIPVVITNYLDTIYKILILKIYIV